MDFSFNIFQTVGCFCFILKVIITECKTFQIPTMLYHGTQQERQKLVKNIHKRLGALQIHPVVITSFEIAMRDRKSLQVQIVLIKFFVICLNHNFDYSNITMQKHLIILEEVIYYFAYSFRNRFMSVVKFWGSLYPSTIKFKSIVL